MTNEAHDVERQEQSDRARSAANAANPGDGDARVLAFDAEGAGPPAQSTLDTQIAAAIPGPYAAVDASHTILRFNAPLTELFPATAEGVSITDVIDHSKLASIIDRVCSGQGGPNWIEFEPAMCGGADDDDNDRIFRLTASALTGPGDSGPTDTVLLSFEDVTGRLMSQERLMEHNRLISVGEMAAGVAHELNNPLTAVLGFSQLVLREEMDDLLRRDIEAIASEAKRAGRIVDNLLSFTRRYQHEMRPFSAVDSVRKVLELREYECRVNNVETVTYLDENVPLTMADGHLIEQVFLNLFNNAIQALSETQGRGTITVGVAAVRGRIRISFADDGPGIPKKVLGKVFDPFFTTKPPGKGTGLGLSICQRIIEQHDGRITVQSRPGKGASFVVELPIVAVEEPPVLEDTAVAQRSRYTMLHVLVVDDEVTVGELVKRTLEEAGHQVDVARDGAEALRMINLDDFDVVLLDMKMPGLGGPEVYRCIKGLRPEIAARVLFMTGDIASPDTKEFIESTDSMLLSKPFNLDDLRDHMEPFVRLKIARMESRQDGQG
ncbi:MAG: response regulator [Chloroflexi bacterium]|nr:response regulator [Chloroflexota bacterium]